MWPTYLVKLELGGDTELQRNDRPFIEPRLSPDSSLV
jgi:hypothetical protein